VIGDERKTEGNTKITQIRFGNQVNRYHHLRYVTELTDMGGIDGNTRFPNLNSGVPAPQVRDGSNPKILCIVMVGHHAKFSVAATVVACRLQIHGMKNLGVLGPYPLGYGGI